MTKTQRRIVGYIDADLGTQIDDFRYTMRIPSETNTLRVLLSAGLASFAQQEPNGEQIRGRTIERDSQRPPK